MRAYLVSLDRKLKEYGYTEASKGSTFFILMIAT